MKTELIEKLEKLPGTVQKEVEDFVDSLIYKDQRNEKGDDGLPTNSSNRKSGFGALKGLVTYISDDFDAPLKEFHDYMYHISIEFIEKIEKLPIDKQKQIEVSVDAMLKEVEAD